MISLDVANNSAKSNQQSRIQSANRQFILQQTLLMLIFFQNNSGSYFMRSGLPQNYMHFEKNNNHRPLLAN